MTSEGKKKVELSAMVVSLNSHKKQQVMPTYIQELTNIVLIFDIFLVKMCQQLDLCLSLDQEGLLRLDDLDSYIFSILCVLCSDDLTKGTFPNPFLDSVAPIEELTTGDNIVIVFVVPSVVVSPCSRRTSTCHLLRRSAADTA